MAAAPPPHKCPAKGAPTWMVTFGDMMALLLTLFVLLGTSNNKIVEHFTCL